MIRNFIRRTSKLLMLSDDNLWNNTNTNNTNTNNTNTNNNNNEPFLIYVKMCDGITLAFSVFSSDTVENLKTKIRDVENVPICYHRLSFNGVYIENENTDNNKTTLGKLNITRYSILHLVYTIYTVEDLLLF